MSKTHLRQKRAVESRAKIVDAAVKVIERHGVENSTIDQIVEEAGLSKGAFYFHFKSKEEILKEVQNQLLRLDHKLSKFNPTIKNLKRNRRAQAYVGIALELHRLNQENNVVKAGTNGQSS